MVMDIVKEAEIIVASLGAPNLDVAWNTAIRGYVSLTNNVIESRTPIVIGYFLGRAKSMYYFTYEGVDYYIGSMIQRLAPEMRTIWDQLVETRAVFTGPWDALAWVGPAPSEGIKLLEWLHVGVSWVIGLNKADVDTRLTVYDQKWFTAVLTVAPPPLNIEVTGFRFYS